jgi:uncharacterized membrane protein YdbT with pleckstrin-like domain
MPENADAPSWLTLTDDEKIVWNSHPSVWTIGQWIVISIILIGIGIGGVLRFNELLQLLSIITIVIGISLTVIQTIRKRQHIHYVITSEEVYKKSGLLSRDVINFPFDSIQNTSYTQTFPERLMTYGTIRIEMAGSGDDALVLHDVPDPEHVIGLIVEQIDVANPQPQNQ